MPADRFKEGCLKHTSRKDAHFDNNHLRELICRRKSFFFSPDALWAQWRSMSGSDPSTCLRFPCWGEWVSTLHMWSKGQVAALTVPKILRGEDKENHKKYQLQIIQMIIIMATQGSIFVRCSGTAGGEKEPCADTVLLSRSLRDQAPVLLRRVYCGRKWVSQAARRSR